MDEVNVEDIEDIQTRILKRAKSNDAATRNGKIEVKNTLACLRQLFNLAKKKGLIENNPVNKVESLSEAGSRSRILSFEELWIFWNRIEMIGIPPVTAKALKFVLITMQRSTEVRNMRYASLKLEEKTWQLERHETKNKTMHRVPLNRYARNIIDEVIPYTAASPFVFGATRAMEAPHKQKRDLVPLGNTAIPQAVRKHRSILGIRDFCPHDLRRTGAAWITTAGLPKLCARLMLNHSDGGRNVTGEVYVCSIPTTSRSNVPHRYGNSYLIRS